MVVRIEGSHRIETEAVHALVQPEADDLADLLPHCFIRQVKIRHAGPEACFVIKIGTFERLVAGLLFIREIVIRDLRARLRISLCGAKCIRSSLEPGMFRRRVVERQIQDHLDVPGVARLKECFQVGHRPILRIDVHVIRHIILVVRRRGEDRHQPDAAAAEVVRRLRIAVIHIVQRLEGTLQVPDPVAITVRERVNEDLIARPAAVIRQLRGLKLRIQCLHGSRRAAFARNTAFFCNTAFAFSTLFRHSSGSILTQRTALPLRILRRR